MKYSFKELLHDLKTGREIEFNYNGKTYSIVNGNDKWYFCEENQITELCDFEETDILQDKIKKLFIQNKSVDDIINKKLYMDKTLYIL